MSAFGALSPGQIALVIAAGVVAVLAVLAGLAYAAYWVFRLCVWLAHILRRALRFIKAGWRRLKSLVARFWQIVLPYPHSAFKALIYIVLILAASLIAPPLTQWIADILSLLLPNDCASLRSCLAISVVAGSTTGFLFIFVREKPLSLAGRILARLSGSANPGGGTEPEHVRFEPHAKALRLPDDEREYLGIEYALRGVNE